MAGTDRRNSRTQGVREPGEMGLERESWFQRWVYMGKGEESGKGLSWIHLWPDKLPYSSPFWQNSVSTPLTVTCDLGIDLPREIRGKVSRF